MAKGITSEEQDLSLELLGRHDTACANFAVSGCDLLIA